MQNAKTNLFGHTNTSVHSRSRLCMLKSSNYKNLIQETGSLYRDVQSMQSWRKWEKEERIKQKNKGDKNRGRVPTIRLIKRDKTALNRREREGIQREWKQGRAGNKQTEKQGVTLPKKVRERRTDNSVALVSVFCRSLWDIRYLIVTVYKSIFYCIWLRGWLFTWWRPNCTCKRNVQIIFWLFELSSVLIGLWKTLVQIAICGTCAHTHTHTHTHTHRHMAAAV